MFGHFSTLCMKWLTVNPDLGLQPSTLLKKEVMAGVFM